MKKKTPGRGKNPCEGPSRRGKLGVFEELKEGQCCWAPWASESGIWVEVGETSGNHAIQPLPEIIRSLDFEQWKPRPNVILVPEYIKECENLVERLA